MPRKVFISFLGTTDYVECYYDIDGRRSQPVRFVQEALIADGCKDWDAQNDKIYIFCTAAATDNNWNDGGQAKSPQAEGLERRLLGALSRLGIPADIMEKVDIPEGFSEAEIWQIFSAVYDKLQKDDEIYFDVTHAFRFIPMLTTVLFNYAQAMKRVRVMSIKYGAFEKLGPAYKVKELPLEERVAPVLELKSIADLQFYTEAASDLERFGNVKSLVDAIPGPGKKVPVLEEFASATEELVKNLAINRMEEIKSGHAIKNIRATWKPVKKAGVPKPVQLIMERLMSYTADFVPEDSYANVEAAIAWDVKYQMFPQAFTMLQEYVISRVCDWLKGDAAHADAAARFEDDKPLREFVSAVLGLDEQTRQDKTQWHGQLREHEALADSLLSCAFIQALRPAYGKLTISRNAINHAKKTNNVSAKQRCEELQQQLQECFAEIKDALAQLPQGGEACC